MFTGIGECLLNLKQVLISEMEILIRFIRIEITIENKVRVAPKSCLDNRRLCNVNVIVGRRTLRLDFISLAFA